MSIVTLSNDKKQGLVNLGYSLNSPTIKSFIEEYETKSYKELLELRNKTEEGILFTKVKEYKNFLKARKIIIDCFLSVEKAKIKEENKEKGLVHLEDIEYELEKILLDFLPEEKIDSFMFRFANTFNESSLRFTNQFKKDNGYWEE